MEQSMVKELLKACFDNDKNIRSNIETQIQTMFSDNSGMFQDRSRRTDENVERFESCSCRPTTALFPTVFFSLTNRWNKENC